MYGGGAAITEARQRWRAAYCVPSSWPPSSSSAISVILQKNAIFVWSSPSPKDSSDEVAKKRREEQRRKGTKVLGAAARRKQQPAQHNTTQETLAERRSQAEAAMGAGKPTANLLRNQWGGRPMRKRFHGSTAADRRGFALQHSPSPATLGGEREAKRGSERGRQAKETKRAGETGEERKKRAASRTKEREEGRDSTNRLTEREREKRSDEIDRVNRCAAQRSGPTLSKLG